MSAPASPQAKRIVRAIITDLKGRVGISNEWHRISPEVKAVIEDTWCRLVDEQLKGSIL